MPYTMEDFKHDIALEYLSELTTEEILQSVLIDIRLKRISVEEVEAYIEKRKANKSNPDEK